MTGSTWPLPRGARSAAWRSRELRPTALAAIEELLPTFSAPYAEALPQVVVRRYCRQRGWRLRSDAAGNLIVRIPGRRRTRPALAFEAHLDHPAMIVHQIPGKSGINCQFYGGFPPARMSGNRVRLVEPRGRGHALATVVEAGARNPRTGAVEVLLELRQIPRGGPVPAPGWLGVWDLPLQITKRRIRNGVCDDLAGAASILAGLDLATRSGLEFPVLAYFTRCEENGFIGCLEGLHLGSFPVEVPVIVLECSPQLPNARLGDGPVCRVGDRLSIYDPKLIAFLETSAQVLSQRVPDFRWQRKLMDGGACEATAYCAAGMRAAGLALPLEGYHNVPPPGTAAAVPEEIDRLDQENVVLWIATLALGAGRNHPSRVAAELESLRGRRRALLYPSNGSSRKKR